MRAPAPGTVSPRRSRLLFLVALAVAHPVAAQKPDTVRLASGQWVRLETPDRTIEGELRSVSRHGSRIRHESGSIVRLSREETENLQVRVRRGRFREIVGGSAAVGAGLGLLIGGIAANGDDECGRSCDPWRSETAARSAFVGLGVGVSVGLIAAALHGRERWAAGAVIFVRPSRTGRLELSASYPLTGRSRRPRRSR